MTSARSNEAAASFCLRYGDETIDYIVRWVRPAEQRRIAVHVDDDGKVAVDAPLGAPIDDVRGAVAKRARWISRQLAVIEKRDAGVLPREYVSGETWYYLGRRHLLKVRVGAGEVRVGLRNGRFEVDTPLRDADVVRAALFAWYRERAEHFLRKRVDEIAADLPWIRQAPSVSFRPMRRQWGSCSPLGRITLNRSLVQAPRECIDYVVLHELCHLREHNHARRFFRLLTSRMPRWPTVKERLDALAGSIVPM